MDQYLELLPSVRLTIAYAFVVFVLVYLYHAVYNVFFHPLRNIPGPFLSAASEAPHFLALFSGHGVTYVKAIHDKYGTLVRIGPNRVSYNGAAAIKEVYGTRPGRGDLVKDPELYVMPPSGVRGIGESDDVNHARQRRYLGPAFSAKALEEQEYLVKDVVGRLIGQLKARQGQEMNIVHWFDWTMFDLIGILALNFDFDCIKNAAYHPWIQDMFTNFKVMGLMFAAQSVPGMSTLLKILIPKSIFERRYSNFEYLRSLVHKRMTTDTATKDLMSFILAHAEDKEVREGEMETNAWSIIVAGSETSATLLSGAIYNLLKKPSIMTKITTQLRQTFPAEDDIRHAELIKMPYLMAVLEESLRIYPPAPFGLSRVVPAGGAQVGNAYLPEGTRASASHWAVFHNKDNFAEPDAFIPERWLESRDEKFEHDQRESLMPFSAGRRNCIAKNLAYMQMRMILARVLWNFDFELLDSSKNWDDQKVFMAWDKKPLNIKIARCYSSRTQKV